MYRLVFTIIPILFLCPQRIAGQEEGSSFEVFSGKVLDDSLGHAIPSVHIWNESTRMGCISNDAGEFSMSVKGQDTLVFSVIGYWSKVIVLSSSLHQNHTIRLKPQKYEIGEVVVRRFRSYQSFLYHATHLNLPESEIAELKEHLKVSSLAAAMDADRERAVKDKVETGRFGYITPLGKGIDQKKAFMAKIRNMKEREEVILTKFNRDLVGEITKLEGEELTKFIAHCNFSEEYLYQTDLYTIIEDLESIFVDYQAMTDTIPPVLDN